MLRIRENTQEIWGSCMAPWWKWEGRWPLPGILRIGAPPRQFRKSGEAQRFPTTEFLDLTCSTYKRLASQLLLRREKFSILSSGRSLSPRRSRWRLSSAQVSLTFFQVWFGRVLRCKATMKVGCATSPGRYVWLLPYVSPAQSALTQNLIQL
jgi:hypothetical protein